MNPVAALDSIADSDVVTGVKIADNSTNAPSDVIVNNYREFYQLYLAFEDSNMTGADSLNLLAMANLCPFTNGSVVYKARALYSLLFDDLSVFNDDSCGMTVVVDTGMIANKHSSSVSDGKNVVQQYSLHPNPTKGKIYIQQAVRDEQPVYGRVMNVAGQTMYRGELLFSNKQQEINLSNAASGLYLLNLTDSQGKEFVLKFVIE